MSWTVGDLEPPLRGTATDGDVGVDLTAATSCDIHLQRPDETVVIRAAIQDPNQVTNKGKWSMVWVDGDLSVDGWYETELQVTWPGTRPQTFGKTRFKVNAQIA